MLESSHSLTRKMKLETSWRSLLVINHVILNMFRSLLLASRIDVLFKRMYLKKMTALFDFSFLKTGNLSSPPDSSILVPWQIRALALAFSGWAHKGVEFPDPLERCGAERQRNLWFSWMFWVLCGFDKGTYLVWVLVYSFMEWKVCMRLVF